MGKRVKLKNKLNRFLSSSNKVFKVTWTEEHYVEVKADDECEAEMIVANGNFDPKTHHIDLDNLSIVEVS